MPFSLILREMHVFGGWRSDYEHAMLLYLKKKGLFTAFPYFFLSLKVEMSLMLLGTVTNRG